MRVCAASRGLRVSCYSSECCRARAAAICQHTYSDRVENQILSLFFWFRFFFFSSKQQIDHCDRQYLIFTGLRQIPDDANNLLFNLDLAFSAYRTFSYLSENKFVWQRDFKWWNLYKQTLASDWPSSMFRFFVTCGFRNGGREYLCKLRDSIPEKPRLVLICGPTWYNLSKWTGLAQSRFLSW